MKTQRLLPLLCLALGLSVIAGAYQWPVEKKTVVATFGQSFSQDFYRGLSIAGKDAPVSPIEEGGVVFYREEGEDPEGLPSGLGSFLVMEHGLGIRSLYGHLELDEEILTEKKKTLSSQDTLGLVGETGFTEGARLFLMLIDQKVEQIINPYLILPPLEEKSRPVITKVSLSREDSRLQLPLSQSVTGGEWEVAARIYDPCSSVPYFCPTAPYRIGVYLNGQTSFQITFDAVKVKDGRPRIYPSADLDHGALYLDDFQMRLGTVHLKKGIANLEISVRDFAGNERSQSYQFRVH